MCLLQSLTMSMKGTGRHGRDRGARRDRSPRRNSSIMGGSESSATTKVCPKGVEDAWCRHCLKQHLVTLYLQSGCGMTSDGVHLVPILGVITAETGTDAGGYYCGN